MFRIQRVGLVDTYLFLQLRELSLGSVLGRHGGVGVKKLQVRLEQVERQGEVGLTLMWKRMAEWVESGMCFKPGKIVG